MQFLPLIPLSIAGLLFLYSAVQAAIPPACNSPDTCAKPLEDVTIITPGEFLVAKLQCHGCPTGEWSGSGPSRRHRVTHEENALFYNISISDSKTELLLNDVTIFPLPESIGNTEQPPQIYVPQVPVNFSLPSLLSTIECTQQPCQNYNGKCFCIPDSEALGSMGVDYKYTFSPNAAEGTLEDGEKWTLSFDALGGSNGFADDPFATFNSAEQKMVVLEVRQDQQGVLSILGANVTAREHSLEPAPRKSFQEKVWHFFGVREDIEEGSIIYRQDEWDMYGRTGTLDNLLKEIRYGWPWSLIVLIVGSVIGGLTVLYVIYRLVMFVVDGQVAEGNRKWNVEDGNETWSRERGYHREELGDEVEKSGFLAGDEDIDEDSDSEALLGSIPGPSIDPVPRGSVIE